MKLIIAALFLWFALPSPKPEPRYFRFVRAVAVAPGTSHTACGVLDGGVFQHSPRLADLRLLADGHEIPFALMTSQTAVIGDEASVLNAGVHDESLVFDLRMPSRPYTDVRLNLSAKNFIAEAKVTGLQSPKDRSGVQVGSFTLFDLSAQNLGRNTTLRLGDSTFPFLHVALHVSGVHGVQMPLTADVIAGADVPPSRDAQTLYTTVEQTGSIVQRGRESVATFLLPAHVPVERVRVEMAPGDRTNFSRPVRISARAQSRERAQPEEIAGEVSRIHLTEGGREIEQQNLATEATIGSNGQFAATVEVAIENGDDPPLALRTVNLEMRERRICFDAAAAAPSLFYGDSELAAPEYDYPRTFDPAAPFRVAAISAETRNPQYAVRPDERSFTGRHPGTLWAALLLAVAALGAVAYRSSKQM